MSDDFTDSSATTLLLPNAPAISVRAGRGALVTPDGEIDELPAAELRRALRGAPPPLVCHAVATGRRLDAPDLLSLDLLELYAFVRPARPCLPTPRGLARALGLTPPDDVVDEAVLLPVAAERLLAELAQGRDDTAVAVARKMGEGGWPWARFVLAALAGIDPHPRGMAVWRGLAEFEDYAPAPPPGMAPIEPDEARAALAALVGRRAGASEQRAGQLDFAALAAEAFRPPHGPGSPAFVLAEAGTGVGKTLGYLAPAALWAERNAGAVWISTYTRNLQHQIDAELDRVFPDPKEKAARSVLRKGRENYLCLLNLEEAVQGLTFRSQDATAVGLMTRWTGATRAGDLTGGDFPGWLPELMGRPRTVGLADRRGECIHSACSHYSRCFVERVARESRQAEIVVANHALVMIQATLGADAPNQSPPTRIVFDEGHHLFDAADSAFSARLSGLEGEDLRRWLLGAEDGPGRARGLKRRVEDLVHNQQTQDALVELIQAARALPAEGWRMRLADNRPMGPLEGFLHAVRGQIVSRAERGGDGPYGLEVDARPALDAVLDAADAAAKALRLMLRPAAELRDRLERRLEDEADDLDSGLRGRIDAACRSLQRRVELAVGGWAQMLDSLAGPAPGAFVDWFALDRIDRRDVDVGMRRHWIDPTLPFAEHVAGAAHGVLIASATLTDSDASGAPDWRAALQRSGAAHLAAPAITGRAPSPFDYAAQARAMIVTDVRKDDLAQVAAAYRELFRASGGGAVGLFTAISRLRAVRDAIAPVLEHDGYPLLAQHVDGLETATLIDIFREEEDACLLGVDAVRDGVDAPGRTLRLIVFDRTPWPRPDILHRARRAAFGGRAYDDRIARFRLKQAFGRLIRRADDRGVFVLLDPLTPSRLFSAFPAGVTVEKVGLAEAVRRTRAFLAPPA